MLFDKFCEETLDIFGIGNKKADKIFEEHE
jgi:hypothetical protein